MLSMNDRQYDPKLGFLIVYVLFATFSYLFTVSPS